jgi:hypothetical protein
MSYTVKNAAIYIAVYAGALAGLGASDRQLTSDTAADYDGSAEIAGAFAQEFDTLWGTAPASDVAVEMAEECALAYWARRSPVPTARTILPATYETECAALIALITSAENYFNGQGIPTNGGAAGGAVFFRPGVATSPPYYETWDEIADLIDLNPAIEVVVMSGGGAATVTRTVDCKGQTTFVGECAIYNPVGTYSVLDIGDGFQLQKPKRFTGMLRVTGTPTALSPITISNAALLIDQAAVLRLANGAGVSLITVEGEEEASLVLDQNGTLQSLSGAHKCVNLKDLANLNIRMTRMLFADLDTDAISGEGGTSLFWEYDETITLPTLTGFLGSGGPSAMAQSNQRNNTAIATNFAATVTFEVQTVRVKTSGEFRISIGMCVTSDTNAKQLDFQLTKDGVVVASGPKISVVCDSVSKLAYAYIDWVISTNAAIHTAVTFGMKCTPVDGAVNVKIADNLNCFGIVQELNVQT